MYVLGIAWYLYTQYTYGLRYTQCVETPSDIDVTTAFTCIVMHVCFKHFTPCFSQGGLDTEVDLLLQQLEDRLCALVRGHMNPFMDWTSYSLVAQTNYGGFSSMFSLILWRYGRWSNVGSLGFSFNCVKNNNSMTLFLTNFLGRWLARSEKKHGTTEVYIGFWGYCFTEADCFRKELRKNYRNYVSGASPMAAEDLDSRSLALQKMDRKDHSRPHF